MGRCNWSGSIFLIRSIQESRWVTFNRKEMASPSFKLAITLSSRTSNGIIIDGMKPGMSSCWTSIVL